MGWARAERVLLKTMFGRNKENRRLQEKREKECRRRMRVWLEFGSAFRAQNRSQLFICVVAARRNKGDTSSLFLSRLCALSGAGIVADLLPEANGHGNIAVVHGDHCHLFSWRPVRDAETPQVWLKKERRRVTNDAWSTKHSRWNTRIDSAGYDSRSGCERSWVQIPNEPTVFVWLELQWLAWFELNCPLRCQIPKCTCWGHFSSVNTGN